MYTKRFILYRNSELDQLINQMTWLSGWETEGGAGQKGQVIAEAAGNMVRFADEYGLSGNLWTACLALFAATNENAFATSWETRANENATVNEIAKLDLEHLSRLIHLPLEELGLQLKTNIFKVLMNYRSGAANGRVFDEMIQKAILRLAEQMEQSRDAEELFHVLTNFYQQYGVGKFGLHKAFRISETEHAPVIEAISNVEKIYLQDLVGYERQKSKLLANTEAFIEGRAANNVLLFGDSGTGKSSSIKAILNEYYGRGLRMIEVYKHQFKELSGIISQIKDRNYKFIIYMDDLSFEDFELEYKYLKAIIEGGLGEKPDNVLIYATSNRRHLIREKFSDKRELSDDLHKNDTVQEKLSLAARFGVTIYFGSPDKKEFRNIVKILAQRYDVEMDEEKLFELANQWELTHGGLSGRTAAQFITHLMGM